MSSAMAMPFSPIQVIKEKLASYKPQFLQTQFGTVLRAQDIGFIILHIIMGFLFAKGLTDFSTLFLFKIDQDQAVPETFQYAKEILCAVFLIYMSIKHRTLNYLFWAALFLYLFMDDCYSVHETIGEIMSPIFGFKWKLHLRAADWGEALVTGVVALTFLVTLTRAFQHGDRLFKQVTWYLTQMILLLAFFGVFVDMVHMMVPGFIMDYVAVIEDGGEMIIMSLVLCYLAAMAQGTHKSPEVIPID